jgi:hypothetical protein
MLLRRLHGYPLALAITLALVVKALILFGLWKAFFSAPQAKHMRMPTAAVEQHLLAPPSPAPKTPSPPPPKGK